MNWKAVDEMTKMMLGTVGGGASGEAGVVEEEAIKIGSQIGERISGQLGAIQRSLANIVKELGEHDHFEAAAKELRGIATRGDHVQELTDFANGLRSSAIKLQRMLGTDGLSPELRSQIQQTLSTVSKLRDKITNAIGNAH